MIHAQRRRTSHSDSFFGHESAVWARVVMMHCTDTGVSVLAPCLSLLSHCGLLNKFMETCYFDWGLTRDDCMTFSLIFRPTTEDEALQMWQQRFGSIFSTALFTGLFTWSNRKQNFVPSIIATQLWLEGASVKLCKTLSSYGTSVSRKSAIYFIIKLGIKIMTSFSLM